MRRFNARVPWPIRYALVLAAGLMAVQVLVHGIPLAYFAYSRATGSAPNCPWQRVLSLEHDANRFLALSAEARKEIRLLERDPARGLIRVSVDQREFWAPDDAVPGPEDNIIAFITAEYRYMEEMNPDSWVRPGDVVIDCGAHVGIFTHRALAAGAKKVIAVEPEPRNLICLGENFAAEIASGRVVIAPLGVWSEETELDLGIQEANSGMHSVLHPDAAQKVTIQVTTVDRLVEDHQLDRVDFIKMDIEGAEQEALRGATGTLLRFRPRLAIASYHREDDFEAIPAIIRGGSADYAMTCGPCAPSEHNASVMIPHMTYYE